jgi:hypothetical protein
VPDGHGLTGQQWTIVLRQESFNVRFRVISDLTGDAAISALTPILEA